MFTREQLVALRQRETLKAGPADVTILMLSSGDLCEFLYRYTEAKEDGRAQLVAFRHLVGCSLVDAEGKRLYPAGSEQESGELPPDVFDAVRDRALKLNVIAKEESDAAGKG